MGSTTYPRTPESPAAPAAAGLADLGETGSAFPPAWVKTPADFDDWLEAEVKETLAHPGPTLSNEEFWAITDEYLEKIIREKEARDAAHA